MSQLLVLSICLACHVWYIILSPASTGVALVLCVALLLLAAGLVHILTCCVIVVHSLCVWWILSSIVITSLTSLGKTELVGVTFFDLWNMCGLPCLRFLLLIVVGCVCDYAGSWNYQILLLVYEQVNCWNPFVQPRFICVKKLKKLTIFLFFFEENISCGYSLEVPHWSTSNEYPQNMFSLRSKKRYLYRNLDTLPGQVNWNFLLSSRKWDKLDKSACCFHILQLCLDTYTIIYWKGGIKHRHTL